MNTTGIHINRQEILLHFLFWMTWIISFTFVQSIGLSMKQWLIWLTYYIGTLPVFISHTYLIAYWLIPKTFFKGRYWQFTLGFLLLLFFFSALELIISNELIFKYIDESRVEKQGYLNLINIFISGVGNLYIVMVFLAIQVGRSWFRTKNAEVELLQTKKEADFEFYRYQFQPMIVESLMEELEIVTETIPQKAPDMIVGISNFLNHFLYDSKEEMLPLEMESRLLKEYMEIHEKALGERINNNFFEHGTLKSFVIPPLLLLPFMEVAIKSAYKCNKFCESTVIIKTARKYVLFSFSFWCEEALLIEYEGNIDTTKDRLEYYFPGKHRLKENRDENFLEVSLELFL